MIINISLWLILWCCIFIVVCDMLDKIKIYPSTKGILCLSMLAMIGGLTRGFHSYADFFLEFILVCISVLILRQTYVAYKRGFL